MDAATTTAGLSDLKFRLVRGLSPTRCRGWPELAVATRGAGALRGAAVRHRRGLTISGFDYEVSAEAQVAAEIASPGSVLVSGRLLSDIVRALPNKPIDFYVDGNRVALNCGSARFAADDGRRGLPDAAHAARGDRDAAGRSVRRGDRAGCDRGRPRRHLPMLTGIR